MSYYTLKAAGPKKAELVIYGIIGLDDDTTAAEIAKEIKAMGELDQIDVHINSPGGSMYQGLAIYNTLKNHPAKIVTHNDGMAASAASLILMAGDEINSAENAVVMIHRPMIAVAGNEIDLQSALSGLQAGKESIVGVYASRTGQKPEDVRAWIDAETYFSASDAKTNGFVTNIIPNKKAVAAKYDPAALKNFSPRVREAIAALGPVNPPKENPMPTDAEIKAQAEADAKAKLDAELKANAEKAAAEKKAADDKAHADALATAKAEGIAAENKRITEIKALCVTAGLPEKADALIADPKRTVEMARETLFNAMAAKNKALGDGGTGDPTNQNDEDAAYKKEYAATKDVYAKQGVTEAEYVRSRRIDDKKEVLQPKALAAAGK